MVSSTLLAVTFAKLREGLTFDAFKDTREGKATDGVEVGEVPERCEGRSDAVREFVLDIFKRSRSFSTRSEISFSFPVTSTGL